MYRVRDNYLFSQSFFFFFKYKELFIIFHDIRHGGGEERNVRIFCYNYGNAYFCKYMFCGRQMNSICKVYHRLIKDMMNTQLCGRHSIYIIYFFYLLIIVVFSSNYQPLLVRMQCDYTRFHLQFEYGILH